MATSAADKRKADEAAAAKADAHNDKTDHSADVEAAVKESEEQAKHVGSDSNIDKGVRDDTGIAQPTDNVQELSTTADAQGIDRIVQTGVQDAWVPAPVEPDPEAVKAAEERNAKFEAERKAYRENQIDPVSGRLKTDEKDHS